MVLEPVEARYCVDIYKFIGLVKKKVGSPRRVVSVHKGK